jgi:hypothetical protein
MSTILLCGISFAGLSQGIDHWETIVYHDDNWNYKIGVADIPLNWIEEDFDASLWSTAPGGFGYGDGDDNTIIDDVISVFMIREFEVLDREAILRVLLHADYDDGFVAYVNGVEVARKNLGLIGQRVPYDETTPQYSEAAQVEGLLPIGISISPHVLKIGSNKLAIQVHNHTATSSDLSSNFYLSVGLSDDTIFYRETPEWFNESVFESNLPILKVITTNDEEINDEPRIDAHLGVIYNGEEMTNSPFDKFNHYDGAISIEIRGTSSQSYDKKGYGFETQNADGTNNNVGLLGMPEENDWILHGPYSDKSLLRNSLTYHIGNLTGRYAPRTQLCELYINDKYEGIYLLTEKIKEDRNRVDIAKLTQDDNEGDELTGGYIIKVDRNDQNIPGLGWNSGFPDNKFFAFVEPKADDITGAQATYIKEYMFDFESNMAASDYASVYTDYIDVESLVDYFLVTEIGKHIDAYKLSFYMYKDKDSKGGKLHFGPLWDFNFGYGNFDFDCSPDYFGWAYEFPDCGSWHPFWARQLIDIPNIQHLSNCRWQELRSGPLQTDSLMNFIDEKVLEMGGAIDRNFDRWQILGEYVWANDFIGMNYEEELNFLKIWLFNRLEWLDANMLGDCDQYVTNTKQYSKSPFSIYPNPTNGTLNISSGQKETMVLEFYGLANELIRSERMLANSSASYDVLGLPDGMYTLIFRSEATQQVVHRDRVVLLK